MKYQHKFNRFIACTGLFVIVMGWWGCKVDTILDPNNPSIGGVTQNAQLGELQNLVVGAEAGMRIYLGTYLDDVSMIGREYYRFAASDPRVTGDILGKGSATLDNNTFYTTNPFAGRYRVVKNMNVLIQALQNTKADITADQRRAGIAYAKTVQAHELLMALNLEYQNGIRVDVSDPDHLGPFLSYDESLNAIQNLLNDANTDLQGNTATLPFTTTLYNNKASEFSKFNRALAARVAAYRKDWTTAATALSQSFLSLTGSLTDGSYYLFSTGGGDLLNPVFFPQNTPAAEVRVTQPNWVSEATPGDARLSKAPKRTSTATQDGLNSDYDFFVYTTNVAPIPIIRNEELVLLYAEVKIQQNQFPDALIALNRIRTAASLPAYTGPVTQPALITEMLNQRRYSLFGEGHRWIDMRRYNLLNTLPIDRPGDDVWPQFPRPATEVQQ
ncbi:carbohydrate-binding protein SusD [Niastella koreensis]|uniref:RagB/SusD domain-containing protein n=2 Tax=Niastella koreensis TaxID=354356 RepID=G8T8E5_NIAKG|nr:RagB/SusD family nutrient uptake outer membrane protein [Niastella koreensis]AEV99115.1 RagB/SusD domain-containing protein [Niastella koreensis GR20-10]OQP44119.1 carbohydrate-binding protein SusD [Niastella koreensis]